ncbi:MAG: recombinase RecF [Sulfurimonas sp.]|nr:recombinase RecF [Sulfurimonas sp.]
MYEKEREALSKLELLNKQNSHSLVSDLIIERPNALDEMQNKLSLLMQNELNKQNEDTVGLSSAVRHQNISENSKNTKRPQTEDKEERKVAIKINKITLNNFRFFAELETDDENYNVFEPSGQNMLIYGENGSGKSSLYKAFEFLATPTIDKEKFEATKNCFREDKDVSLVFEFDNEKTLTLGDLNLSLEDGFDYVKNLSVFMPMIDYKKLFEVSHTKSLDTKKKDLYPFFETILENYPITIKNKEKLKELKEFEEDSSYFDEFSRVIKEDLFEDINKFLDMFEQNFKLTQINCVPYGSKVFLEIDYFNKPLVDYHNFLNEARLSALAISIYFSIIKKQFSLLKDDSLKILVLDDLLISLDMNNRRSLMNILKKEFTDSEFQIFFFTHDKNLFDEFLSNKKIKWKAYEMYVEKDESNEFEYPKIKQSYNYLQKAKIYLKEHDYPASANYLRKELERIKKVKDKEEENIHNKEKIFKKFKKVLSNQDFTDIQAIDSSKILGQLKGFKEELDKDRDSSTEIDLKNIGSLKSRILNPLSHDDTSKPIYKKELEEAITMIEKALEV